jgi:hypothetical protein
MQVEIRSLSYSRMFNYICIIFYHVFESIITETYMIENKLSETGANLSFKVTILFAGNGITERKLILYMSLRRLVTAWNIALTINNKLLLKFIGIRENSFLKLVISSYYWYIRILSRFYIVSSETASRPNKRLMRTYHWISLFMSYIKSAN